MRSIVIAGLALGLAAPAAAAVEPSNPRLAVGDDGTVAVLYSQSVTQLRVRPPGGALSAPVPAPTGGVVGVLPDGTVRLTGLGATPTEFDNTQIFPTGRSSPLLQSVLRRPDGTLGEVQSLPLPTSDVRLGVGPDGSTVALWPSGAAAAVGDEPLAPEAAPGLPAARNLVVARGGRALAGVDCAAPCRVAIVERAAGGPFGPPQAGSP